jgi:N-hydroxyarylamine O-acetyltransferase
MPFDLAAYLKRIEYAGPTAPTLETLRDLHLAHATHIPFENLDILLGRPIRIDLDSVFSKLVTDQRGGYCFEQNTLFAAVLESIGFQVKRLSARVRMGYEEVRPRTHMLLAVDIQGEPWIADAGFGGEGLLHPLPLRPGEVARHFDWQYRIAPGGDQYVLQSLHPEGWFDLYTFTLEEQHPIDYEMANYFTSTHPHSRFVQLLVAQKPDPQCRVTLVNRRLLRQTPRSAYEEILEDDGAIVAALEKHFSLRFPPGTRFRFQESGAASTRR